MPKIPPIALSVGAAIVLFAGTTAGILAVQGRLGELLGKKPAAGAAGAEGEAGAESKPAGDGAHAKPATDGDVAHKDPRGQDAKPEPLQASIAKNNKKTPERDGPHEGATAGGESAQGITELRTPKDGGDRETKAKSEMNKSLSLAPEAPSNAHRDVAMPKRGATSPVVAKFALPSPFTPEELDALVHDLKNYREQYEALQAQAAKEKAANERDRIDIEATYAKLSELQNKLNEEKRDVQNKVSELSKRVDALTAGEERFVKMTVTRIKDLSFDEMKVQLFDLDTRLAAQVVSRLEPKKQGKLIHALPADKRVAMTKMLEAMSRLGEEPAGTTPKQDTKSQEPPKGGAK
jgi:hypothetical protein